MEENNFKDTTVNAVKEINNNFINGGTLPNWNGYSAVAKFKSVRRAIKRGHVDLMLGIVYQKRPFNNRQPTPGRSNNQLKKKVYGQIKGV